MNLRLYCLEQHPEVRRRFRTAVSLHGHTLCSEEPLQFLPRLATSVPALNFVVQACTRRHRAVHREPLDFQRAWWTPPLTPQQSLDLERRQIESCGGWNALVSLTDHDTIAGVAQLPGAPMSIEWTVPFGLSFLHVGVHNLGPRHRDAVEALHDYTRAPEPRRLREIFEWLDGDPSCLLVLNHPCWDEKNIGAASHLELVADFLDQYSPFLHALELNGLRTWSENRMVMELAQAAGLPVISGGDRHGLEPNSILNLTNAGDFPEFVQDLRKRGQSHLLFMPQYRHSQRRKFMDLTWDVMREYPDHPLGRRLWSDRMFYRSDDGRVRSFGELWDERPPVVLRAIVSAMGTAQRQPWNLGLKLATRGAQEFAL